jgi:hypothetical protein
MVEHRGQFQSIEEAAMTKLWKNVWVLGATVMGLALSAPALAVTSGVGPYYATPSWDQTLPAATRFIVLTNMNSEAVLDRETGLVWEQSPSTTLFNWMPASIHCVQLSKGGRKGWRLPTIQDLASLIDPITTNPSLPTGHPFTVQSFAYWSASTRVDDATFAWLVDFSDGLVGSFFKSFGVGYSWCVRGGPGVDPQ